MSKYLYFDDIVFTNRDLLVASLADLGHSEVEEGDALPLYGYQGDRRSETAALVVRRRHVGSSSNDLGFERTCDGYVPIISEYDQRTLRSGKFLVELRTAYGEHVVEAVRQRLHGSIRRRVDGGLAKIHVRF